MSYRLPFPTKRGRRRIVPFVFPGLLDGAFRDWYYSVPGRGLLWRDIRDVRRTHRSLGHDWRLLSAAGIQVNANRGRSTFIHWCRRRGMSPDVIQDYVGHHSYNTTLHYLSVDPWDLDRELERVDRSAPWSPDAAHLRHPDWPRRETVSATTA